MAPSAPDAALESICARALRSSEPVAARMRALFALKSRGGPAAVHTLARSMREDASVLVKHEAAYCLGQMRDARALPALEAALRDGAEDVIVRHEAAEAMGAIGDKGVLPVLEEFAHDSLPQEVRETCRLSMALLRCGGEEGRGKGVYTSVDPAPAAGAEGGLSVERLRGTLCDSGMALFERYRAMFALRNVGGDEAVLALCEGMRSDSASALFRHEVAFVLGQMQSPASVETLAASLRDREEHEMVRHEAAEALGSIATPESEKVLMEYRADENDVVRESVAVALDISEYVSDASALHYADTAAQ